MYIYDKIYGGFDVEEPVFERIIKSETFCRLAGINMGCWSPSMPFYTTDYDRYEHSIGVWLLLRKYGASIPEQIAGLIHDISHSAFSHLSDRIFGDSESAQTAQYQDSVHDSFVKKSEIAKITDSCNNKSSVANKNLLSKEMFDKYVKKMQEAKKNGTSGKTDSSVSNEGLLKLLKNNSGKVSLKELLQKKAQQQ